MAGERGDPGQGGGDGLSADEAFVRSISVDETTPLAADSPTDASFSIASVAEEDDGKAVRRFDSNKIAMNLHKVRREALLLRCRVSGPPLLFGTLTHVAALGIMLVNLRIFSPFLFCTSILCAVVGCCLYLLSLLPADHNAVRISAASWCFCCSLLSGVMFVCASTLVASVSKHTDGASWDVSFGLLGLSVAIYQGNFVRRMVLAIAKLRTRSLLYYKWQMFADFCLTWGLVMIVHGAIDFAARRRQGSSAPGHFGRVLVRSGVADEGSYLDVPWWPAMVLTGILLAFIGIAIARRSPPYMPGWLHAWLAAMGKEVSCAAGIAAAIGTKNVESVMLTAKCRCRAVSLDKVKKEHLFSNVPLSAEESQNCGAPVRLGEIDVFVSHSWHDDPDAKWQALQAWRVDFKARFKREPLCWIDKLCIDQTNIKEDLTCLPVYLAGSQGLLILHGETYLTRLWCVLELLIFVLMGGHREDVELRRVAPSAGAAGGCAQDWISRFTVSNTTCSLPEDKDMLFSIVEAGFQSFECFDKTVTEMMMALHDRAGQV